MLLQLDLYCTWANFDAIKFEEFTVNQIRTTFCVVELQKKDILTYRVFPNIDIFFPIIFVVIVSAAGPVYVTAYTGLADETQDTSWNSFVGHWKFPNHPDWWGYQDDFLTPSSEWLVEGVKKSSWYPHQSG